MISAILRQPVVAGDLHVKLELVGGAQRNEDAERDKAAVATAQPVAAPESAEYVVDADLEQLVAELAVAQVVVWHCTRQQLAEDLKTLFTHICHVPRLARASGQPHWAFAGQPGTASPCGGGWFLKPVIRARRSAFGVGMAASHRCLRSGGGKSADLRSFEGPQYDELAPVKNQFPNTS